MNASDPAAQSDPAERSELLNQPDLANHSEPAERATVRGPQAVPTVREALLTRDQAADHALSEEARAAARAHARHSIRRLMRAQLRLGLILGVGFFVILVTTSLLLSATPLGSLPLWGIPLSWVVPGVGFFPLLLGSAWYFRRRAEANELRWAAEVGLIEDAAPQEFRRQQRPRSPQTLRPQADDQTRGDRA